MKLRSTNPRALARALVRTLARWIAISAAGTALAFGQDQDAATLREEAQAAFERAALHGAEGRYQRARAGFRRVVTRYPDTPAAREAQKRLAGNDLFSFGDLVRHGPSDARIDVLVLGDGYTLEQQDAFDDVAHDLPRLFERSLVFGAYYPYFNFLRGNVISSESGIDGYGRDASTALGGRALEHANVPHAVVDHGRVRDVLARIPESEGLALVVVQRGEGGTGGDGVATVGGRSFDRVLHVFGHAFADLGDEFADDQGFRHRVGTTRVNVSLVDDETRVPWSHWIEAGTPGVGTYEGAAGQVRGLWRPRASGCIMNDGERFFCEPCREAIVLAIYERLDPILFFGTQDRALGVEDRIVLREPLEIRAELLQPTTHGLEARWYAVPEIDAPPFRAETRPRSRRGPLAPIEVEPLAVQKRVRNGEARLKLLPWRLEPGPYRLVLRVTDPARPAAHASRERWVLKDDRQLLHAERAFRFLVE